MALGSRAFAAIGAAAVAASAVIAFLMLGGGAGDVGVAVRREEEPRATPAATATATATVAPTPRAEAAALAADDRPPAVSAPPAARASVEVRVLLDGVQPVPGCVVMDAARRGDGKFVAEAGDNCADAGETNEEGTFVLRWVTEPKERLFMVAVYGFEKADRVEGAAQVGALGPGVPVLLAGAAPVTVHIEDRGVPRVRILDAATGR